MTINEAIAGQDIQVLFERLKLELKEARLLGLQEKARIIGM